MRSGASTPSYDSASPWPATTTYRMHRARIAAGTRRPRRVTDCLKANQGKGSHRNIEATLLHHSNTYTSHTTKAKPFPNGTQADILLSGMSTIDNPAARNLYLDMTSTNAMGVTNQEFINRAALNNQPGPG
jgi:hypothetical protein